MTDENLITPQWAIDESNLAELEGVTFFGERVLRLSRPALLQTIRMMLRLQRSHREDARRRVDPLKYIHDENCKSRR